jgi:hypothetical protein
MKINLKELSTQAVESTSPIRKMRLSENAQSMVFQLFTKNVYSNPIGTVVREITSNCFDSHVEAKVNAPVIIKKIFEKETNSHYISFIDFGVGMSPERVYDIYGVYFESTKNMDNTQIGGFGIGGKTPLAYKRSTGLGETEYDNSFYVITNYNGTRYYYLVYEGADTPVISLLHDEPTTEHNGTEVRIPVLEKDAENFAKEMVRQLYYFENVIFEGFDGIWRYGEILTNEYQILRGKSFLFRGNEYSSNVHICLGRVAYPIDYSVLGLNSSDYSIPVAIKLEVGDINVTVSRESLDYSEKTIKMLKSKLVEVKAEIIDMLMKQYDNIVTLKDYFEMKEDFGLLKINNKTISLKHLIKPSDADFTNFRYSFMKMPNSKQLFKLFFTHKSYGKKPKKSRYGNSDEFEGGYSEIQTKENLFYIEKDFVRVVIKQAYVKSLFELYHIIERRNLTFPHMRSEIADLFNVHLDKLVDENDKPVPYVQSLIEMQEEYFAIVQEHVQNYDTIEVPEAFILARKRRNMITDEMRLTTIPVKFYGKYSRSGFNRIKLNELFNYNFPIFYSTPDESYKLENASKVFGTLFNEDMMVYDHSTYSGFRKGSDKTKGSIMFLQISNVNSRYMKYCKNANHVDDIFLKLFYRKIDLVTNYFKTFTVLQKYANLDDLYKDDKFNLIDETWGKQIKSVKKEVSKIEKSLGKYDLNYIKDKLSVYYKINNLETDKKYNKLLKDIEDLKFLEAANNDVIQFISVPRNLDWANKKLFPLLKKVMVL